MQLAHCLSEVDLDCYLTSRTPGFETKVACNGIQLFARFQIYLFLLLFKKKTVETKLLQSYCYLRSQWHYLRVSHTTHTEACVSDGTDRLLE